MNMGRDPYLNTLKTMSTVENVYCQTSSLSTESKNRNDINRRNLEIAINNESTKKYVDEIYSGQAQFLNSWGTKDNDARENILHRGMGIMTNETFGIRCFWGTEYNTWCSSFAVCIRTGIFSYNISMAGGMYTVPCNGSASSIATFRPVIWNT